MIDLLVQLGHELAILTDEIGFDFQTECQIAAMTDFGDLAELIGRLLDVFPGIVPLGVIKREAAEYWIARFRGR